MSLRAPARGGYPLYRWHPLPGARCRWHGGWSRGAVDSIARSARVFSPPAGTPGSCGRSCARPCRDPGPGALAAAWCRPTGGPRRVRIPLCGYRSGCAMGRAGSTSSGTGGWAQRTVLVPARGRYPLHSLPWARRRRHGGWSRGAADSTARAPRAFSLPGGSRGFVGCSCCSPGSGAPAAVRHRSTPWPWLFRISLWACRAGRATGPACSTSSGPWARPAAVPPVPAWLQHRPSRCAR